MMKHLGLFMLSGLFFMVILTGCGGGTPVCADDNLQYVTLDSPAAYAILDTLNPSFSWTYPDPACNPHSYRIDLVTVLDNSGDWTGETGTPDTTWSPSSPLLPGREYEWAVAPLQSNGIGYVSEYRIFFTGPLCDTADLHAPTLREPADGEVIDHQQVGFVWSYPDACLPEQYQVDISTDPTFADILISIGTGTPKISTVFWDEVPNCATYFWRVAALNGTSMGLYSDTKFYRLNIDNECPSEAPATIRGTLWSDQCSVPMDASPVPDPLSEGCVVDSLGVDADGIRQPGEPNLLNMVVNLGPGDCPVSGPMSAVTNTEGTYSFSGLTPGKYCLSVEAPDFLDPEGTGHWTVMPGGHEGRTYRQVLLTAGEVLGGQDFAWYQFTPGWSPDTNTNCRTGPNLFFGILDVAEKGKVYPIDGRNLTGDWLRLMLTPYKGCWVPANSGTPYGDLGKLRVLYDVPTPTPTAAFVSCSVYTSQATCQDHPACQWKIIGGTITPIYGCVSK
jgi:hypothetical protein